MAVNLGHQLQTNWNKLWNVPIIDDFLTLCVVLMMSVVVQGVPSDTQMVTDADAIVAIVMGETLDVAVN